MPYLVCRWTMSVGINGTRRSHSFLTSLRMPTITGISNGLSKCALATNLWPERQKPTIPGRYLGMAVVFALSA